MYTSLLLSFNFNFILETFINRFYSLNITLLLVWNLTIFGSGSHRYATEWLLTMYCRGFSFDLVTRVWDIFFSEGYKIVYRVALALVKVTYSTPCCVFISFLFSVISFSPSSLLYTSHPIDFTIVFLSVFNVFFYF